MHDWFTPEYRAHEQSEYNRIKSKHPSLVTVPFECNAGWFPLLEAYFDEVARLIAAHPGATYRLNQVKEKFACLRIYARTSDDILEAVKAAYDRAARASEDICEVCGKPGVLRNDRGYFMTRCDVHAGGAPPTEPFKHKGD